MKFERGRDIKEALDLGIKEEKGYNITGITDKSYMLPGIKPTDVYRITHSGSRSVIGFCSGKKAMKVVISLMKDPYLDYQYKWIWHPYASGGSIGFYYSSDGEFWVDANNTKGYSFSKMAERSIMEL